MLKKIANADVIVDGDVETMVQSALAIDADSSVDNSDVATLIQMMRCMLKAMDYASDIPIDYDVSIGYLLQHSLHL
jgi:hypothetical protein